MKALSLETSKLLDKLYNLRGKDSVVLAEMDKQKEVSEKTLERTTEEKSELQDKISKLETQHEELESQGEKLKEVLSGIDREQFATVLDSLKINFDPAELMSKVEENLPKTIETVSSEQKTAEEQLVAVEEEMNNAITTIQELGIRRDAALANQDKLNEYFDLSLNGKINITRDSITSLLEQFNFTEEEQREAAKILMFPEDSLYIYESKLNNEDVPGKSISDVIAEAKDAIEVEETNGEVKEEPKVEIEDAPAEESKEEIEETSIELDEMISQIETEENNEEAVVNEETPEENIFDDIQNELNSDNSVENLLTDLGFNYLDFSSQDLDELKENFDEETFRTNVELMNTNNIDLDIFVDYSSLLYDKELTMKVERLINIGKEPIDIYLNPSILVKYTAEKLDNAIALLTSNGMDPKNVPLMAY